MTLKKYKKLLMANGIDRDQAEEDRKDLAKWKRVAVKDGIDPTAVMLKRGDIAETVSYRKRFGTTSRRGCIKHLKEILKNVTVV